MNDKEFLILFADACKNGGCPENLVKMAQTKWQRQVAVEFVLQDKRLAKHEHKIGTIYRITWGIFTLTAIAVVVQVINSLFL